MKLKSINELKELQQMCIRTFGAVPENLIIESPEIVNEAYELQRQNNPAPYGTHSLKVHGVNIVKQIAEVF